MAQIYLLSYSASVNNKAASRDPWSHVAAKEEYAHRYIDWSTEACHWALSAIRFVFVVIDSAKLFAFALEHRCINISGAYTVNIYIVGSVVNRHCACHIPHTGLCCAVGDGVVSAFKRPS